VRQPAGLGTLGRVAYDEELADRIRDLLAGERGVTEKRMFGGLAFLLDGKLAIAASGQGGVLARVDPAQTDRFARGAHVEPAVMRGRTMDGWLRVESAGVKTTRQLRTWVDRGIGYVRTLPAKR
jgi:TfoX/Sxy family transcriptional regulator of competence genes